MGKLLDSQLRAAPRSPLEPAPVSAVSPAGKSSATVIEQKSPGSLLWQYGGEIEIHVSLNELESASLPGGREYLFWSGIEVRIRRDLLPNFAERQYHIAAALYPVSLLWHLRAPLKPGFAETELLQKEDALTQLANGQIQLDQLPFDPFEPDSGWLIARLGDPARPHWQSENTEDAGDGFLVVRNPNRKASIRGWRDRPDRKPARLWFFGLCPESPELLTQFMAHDQSFVELAQTGEIRLRNHPIAADPAAGGDNLDFAVRSAMGVGASAPTPTMTMCGCILDAAIRQALAGREAGSPVSLRKHIWRHFRNLFRDMAQRQWLMVMGKLRRKASETQLDTVEESLEQTATRYYQAHLKVHPECSLLPRDRPVTLEALQQLHKHPPKDFRQARCWEQMLASI